MELIIEPYVGVGVINFKMTRQQVRMVFNNNVKEFKKTSMSETTTDAFTGCHVYYDGNDLCEAVEFFKPAEIGFMGINLLGEKYESVKAMLYNLDNSLEINETGFISFKYGIGIYAPDLDEEDAIVEGVIVFKKGYYD